MDRPILFSGEMVRALLAGRKTQTRRVVKPQPGQSVRLAYARPDGGFTWCLETGHGVSDRFACPYGTAGDRLWARETHYVWSAGNVDGSGRYIAYRATDPHSPCTWTPSIHMPRWASRITLKITDVRVEQLQDIETADAEAEGWPGPDERNSIASAYPIGWYARLWDSINGKRAPWESNPWVWVVAFTVDTEAK